MEDAKKFPQKFSGGGLTREEGMWYNSGIFRRNCVLKATQNLKGDFLWAAERRVVAEAWHLRLHRL